MFNMKYFPASNEKGVVDGIVGVAKAKDHVQMKSRDPKIVIVQNSCNFASISAKLLKIFKVIHFGNDVAYNFRH